MAKSSAGAPEKELAGFLEKYSPEIAALGGSILAKMRVRYPGATQLIYENYNALVIGFGPSERASEAIFSIALYPCWINLFILRGAELDDPERILQGSGKIVRSIRLTDSARLDEPAVVALMKQALERAPKPIPPGGEGPLVIRAISGKLRARLPRNRR